MKKEPVICEAKQMARLYWRWIKECEKAKSPHTIRAYKVSIRIYMEYMKAKGKCLTNFESEDSFSRDTILQWLNWLKDEKGCSPETCNNRLSHIRTFLEYISDRDLKYAHIYLDAISIKPFRYIKKKQYAIPENELTILMQTPDPNSRSGCLDIMIMSFLYGTAVRMGEMRMVQVKDLHLTGDDRYVHIVGKGNKERLVHLPEKIVKNLRNYISLFHGIEPEGESFLFYSRVKGKGFPITEAAIDKRLKNIAKKANEKDPNISLNLHAHQFRRTRATDLSSDGMNPFQIANMLGHANLSTTMKYVDVSIEKKTKDLIAIESAKARLVKPLWHNKDVDLVDLFKDVTTIK